MGTLKLRKLLTECQRENVRLAKLRLDDLRRIARLEEQLAALGIRRPAMREAS